MSTIRAFHTHDWPALCPILQTIFVRGDTYAFPPDASKDTILQAWVRQPAATFVACDADDRVLGAYYIKANQPGNGSHVCNCGYVVAEQARGQGIASQMCRHSQRTAVEMGFLAMQFNCVVATNTGAIRLWHKLGFETVGTLPHAFRHPEQGLVDALILYKWLVDE